MRQMRADGLDDFCDLPVIGRNGKRWPGTLRPAAIARRDARILELRNHGLSIEETGRRVGACHTTVRKVLRRHAQHD